MDDIGVRVAEGGRTETRFSAVLIDVHCYNIVVDSCR